MVAKKDLSMKAFFVTWLQLYAITIPVHRNDGGAVKRLHDIWKVGAPSPQSRIQHTRGYDERKYTPGNYEARLVFPKLLMVWVKEESQRQGLAITDEDVRKIFRAQGVNV